MKAQELIKASLRVIGVISSGETPTSPEMADSLEAFKIMLKGFAVKGYIVYASTIETFPLISGDLDNSIGDGGDLDTVRPVRIEKALVSSGSTDYPVEIIGKDAYGKIAQKTAGGTPSYLYYNPTYPLGLLSLYPSPPDGLTITLWSLKPLTAPDGLTSDVEFPPEYDALIKWNLALDLAPEFGAEPSLIVVARAKDTMSDILSINSELNNEGVSAEVALLGARAGRYDIDHG